MIYNYVGVLLGLFEANVVLISLVSENRSLHNVSDTLIVV